MKTKKNVQMSDLLVVPKCQKPFLEIEGGGLWKHIKDRNGYKDKRRLE